MDADIIIKIDYNTVSEKKSVLRTNLRREDIKDILADWIHSQTGKGEDSSTRNERDIYNIAIVVDLTEDTFITTSNTGNKALTAGIVSRILFLLESIVVRPFTEEKLARPSS